jgi:S-adenosylmethionine uptake transporter
MGIAFIVRPAIVNYNTPLLACVLATVVFALLDIINKKYITHEPILSVIFFSNLFASLCIFPVAWYDWQIPTLPQLCVLGVLGIGSNLILYFLLRAFALSDISVLAPLRYIELVVSMVFGYLFFDEWPTLDTCLGAMVIIACSCFVTYYQNR